MNARTRLIVGVAVVALGAGTLWVAATQSDGDVRYVEQVLADPGAHRAGAYTLLAVPEPQQVPFTGPNGTVLAANPDYGNVTRETISWTRGGVRYYSTHTLATSPQADGTLLWTFRNETRLQPADPQAALPTVEREWTFGRAGEAFPVVAFPPDGVERPDTPRLWAWYAKAPEHPMQPKPSQFTGHLMTALPDGTVLPDGAHVYDVSQFTAGCSSKFLPPEAQAKYQKDYGSSPPEPTN